MKRIICLAVFLGCMLSVLSVSAAQNVVSLHKGYELLTKASEGYPDSEEEKLTNGRYGTPVAAGNASYYYRNGEFVGFHRDDANADGNFVILLDLAESLEDLADFEIGYLNETDVGIFAPVKVTFYISDTRDGDFAFVGERAISESTASGQQKAGVATVTPETPVSGRYVMCIITPRGTYREEDGGTEKTAAWTFIDEVTVLQGKNPLSEPEENAGESAGESGNDRGGSADASGAVGTAGGASPSAESRSPSAGDKGLVLAAILGGSALAAIALIGRRRT